MHGHSWPFLDCLSESAWGWRETDPIVQEGCKGLWPFRVAPGSEGGVSVGEDKSHGNLCGH